ncbi:MAG: hypothetical protein JRI25_04630 [Deltaproteobacteria bacterium]|nr:hypothetical protein [Deltaproteobacteria bacterium]MBW2253865.1 hypothetical protein [Deltaproteobacteria bacterium]
MPAQRPLRIKADHGQIEQVVLNLATNARDAMSRGGTLSIELYRRDLPSGGVVGLEAGSYAVVTTTDTGTGMDAETTERAFDPFFTRKELGRGPGLGLATVYASQVTLTMAFKPCTSPSTRRPTKQAGVSRTASTRLPGRRHSRVTKRAS